MLIRPQISRTSMEFLRYPGSGLEFCIQLPVSFAMQAWAPTVAALAVA